jgi:hypothetical protein
MDVPEFMRPQGKNQKELIKKTGAVSIYAFQDRLDKDGMCPIEIEGGREAFEKVVAFLKNKFNSKTAVANKSIDRRNKATIFSKETIWIRNMDLPELIGACGKTVQARKAKTGVKSITAWQEPVDKEVMCPIEIRGHPEAVKKAATVIMNMFCGVPDAFRHDIIRVGKPNAHHAYHDSRGQQIRCLKSQQPFDPRIRISILLFQQQDFHFLAARMKQSRRLHVFQRRTRK